MTIETRDSTKSSLRIARRLLAMIIVMLVAVIGLDPPVTLAGKILMALLVIAALLSLILIHQTLKES